jgi:FkbM family methyltransferase
VVDNGLQGLVLPDCTAIGDRDGTVRLLRAGAPGRFRVIDSGPPEGRLVGRGEAVEGNAVLDVPCSTLDRWVTRLGIDLDAVTFVKVDVEGYERRVVAGASRVLGCRHIAWQIEIKPEGLRAAGDDPEELYRELQRAFTHFIDLNRRAAGPRTRAASDLPSALRYLDRTGKTDVLLFNRP